MHSISPDIAFSRHTSELMPHRAVASALPLMADSFDGLSTERLIIAGFDRQCRLISYIEQDCGALAISNAIPAFRRAMAPLHVAVLIMAHNHPCGQALPSQTDIATTRSLAALARLAQLELADHLIFAKGQVTSLRALALL